MDRLVPDTVKDDLRFAFVAATPSKGNAYAYSVSAYLNWKNTDATAPATGQSDDEAIYRFVSISGRWEETSLQALDVEAELNFNRFLAAAGGEWILPLPRRSAVGSGDPILPVLLILAFRPLAPSYHDIATHQSLKRFSQGLQLLLDTGPTAWPGQPTDPGGWRKWFQMLYQRRLAVVTLMSSERALVINANDPADPNLDPEVAAAIIELRRSGPLSDSLKAALARLVLHNPSLFASARALLWTKLAASRRGVLPSDVFQVTAMRTATSGVANAANRSEASTLDIRSALLAATNPKCIDFIETLGDEKYDAEFTVDKLEIASLEALITANSSHLPRTPIHLADGPHPPGDGAVAYLPSRQPLIAPAFQYSGRIEGCDSSQWADPFIGGQPLSRTGLLVDHVIKIAPTPYDGLNLVCRTMQLSDQKRLDLLKMTAIFYVTSDEANEFLNDEFVLSFAPRADAGMFVTPRQPSKEVQELYTSLLSDVALATLTNLPIILLPAGSGELDALAFTTAALNPLPPQLPPNHFSRLTCFNQNFVFDPTCEAPLFETEAYLFAPAVGNPKGPTTHLFLVNSYVPVWTPAALGLGQTRNKHVHGGAHAIRFDSRLWQGAPIVGDDRVLAARNKKNVDLSFRTSQRSWTIPDLITETLVKNKVLQASGADKTWLGHDVSVTVHALQKGVMPAVAPDDNDFPERVDVDVYHGLLPLREAIWDPVRKSGEAIIFDQPYVVFRVDFLWTDQQNAELLRLIGLEVVIASANGRVGRRLSIPVPPIKPRRRGSSK